MRKLLKAFGYKLFRDLTFKITLIIGAGVALMMSLLFLMIEKTGQSGVPFSVCTGQSLLAIAVNPAEGFGYSVPINLCIFIVLEFTSGTIRNKIIAGNSKFKIYASLFISGLVFALALMAMYIAVCFGFGCAIGGFDPNGQVFGMTAFGTMYGHFILKLLIITLLSYVTITSISVCVATVFRNVGPCIPITIIYIMVFGMFPMIFASIPGMEDLTNVLSYINPFHSLVCFAKEIDMSSFNPADENAVVLYNITIANDVFIRGIIVNLVYSLGFFALGAHLFVKRDVK